MKTKRLLVASLLGTISLAVVSLSFSLAWYNTSENLFMDDIVIRIESDKEILISDEPIVETLTDSLFYKYDEEGGRLENKDPFKPLSTMFKNEWMDKKGKVELYEYASSLVDYNYSPRHVKADWGYFAKPLYLYSESRTSVTIDTTSEGVRDSFILPIRRKNREYATQLANTEYIREQYPSGTDKEYIIEDISNKLERLIKCMRVGILDPNPDTYNFTIIDPFKEEDTLLGGREDLFATHYYDYYHNNDDNELYEVIYGEVINRDKAVYDYARESDTDAPEVYSSFDSRTKAGVRAFNLDESLNNGMIIKKEDSLSLDEVEKKFYLDLESEKMKELVLVIYIEGWDLDCINSHMGGTFDLNLKFKIREDLGQ